MISVERMAIVTDRPIVLSKAISKKKSNKLPVSF